MEGVTGDCGTGVERGEVMGENRQVKGIYCISSRAMELQGL